MINGYPPATVMGDCNWDTVEEFEYQSPLELFENKKLVKICAPMVRYSK